MKLRITPVEVQNKEFGRELFGYKKNEVNEFLKELANTVEELYEQLSKEIHKSEELQKQLKELETRQEKIIKEAELEARRIKDEAKSIAIELIEQTKKEIMRQETEFQIAMNRKREEIFALDNLKGRFLRRLRDLLDSGKRLIEFFESEYETREIARLSASISEKAPLVEGLLEEFIAKNSKFKLRRSERGKDEPDNAES